MQALLLLVTGCVLIAVGFRLGGNLIPILAGIGLLIGSASVYMKTKSRSPKNPPQIR